MHDILWNHSIMEERENNIFQSMFIPKSPPEGGGPLSISSPSVVQLTLSLCNCQCEKKLFYLTSRKRCVVKNILSKLII